MSRGGMRIVEDWGRTYDDDHRRSKGRLEEREFWVEMTAGTRSRAVGRIVCCATCILAVCAAMAAEESVTPGRSWVGSTFVTERDEFTDAVNYKVIIESERATLTDGRNGAFVMFSCSDDAKWEPAASAKQARLSGFTGGVAVLGDVRRTRRSGLAAEHRGDGFDVRTRIRVDDHGVIGPGMWPTTRSARGLNTILMPDSLAVRLVRQVVQPDAQRLIADTGSGHVHRFDIGRAKPNLRDWMKRCEVLAERDTNLADREAVGTEYELVESLDEFNREQELSLLMPDSSGIDVGARAVLLFTCRAHVEHGYKVLLGVTPSVGGIAPRRETIDDLAERLGNSDSEVEYYHDALAAYAEIHGTGETAVVVPVELRFDSRPSRVVTWWWAKHGVTRGAVSLIGGGLQVVADAVVADQVEVQIQESRPFRFDLLAARPKVAEFVSRCGGWWERVTNGGDD